MSRSWIVLGIAVASPALGWLAERQAAACGGCFHPPTQTVSDITDERMLLSVSPMQSTLYDQIRYAGSPSYFAWVLPIHGTVTVGLSADVLFESIDALTSTQITPPPQNCPAPSNCSQTANPGPVGYGASHAAGDGVAVLKKENVGPYETVQLHATDSSALSAWLAQNGFNIPPDVKPVIEEYVVEGFDFLAMKLLPNQGVQAMRPVRVTTTGASLSLPLRMAAVGTGPTVGITIWVVADGRYEPQNFGTYHIDDSQLVWDWSTNASNYTILRVQNEAAGHNSVWEIESSLTLNEQLVTNVILSGGQYYGNYGGGAVGVSAPSDPSLDYLPVGDPDAGVGADGGVVETAEEVRTADVNTLFAGMAGSSVRVTRMRSDIAHAAMAKDFVLRASADQSELSNIRNVTRSVNLACPLYNGCAIVGSGTPAQAAASVGGGTPGGSYAQFPGSTRSSGQGSNRAQGPNSASAGGCAVSVFARSPSAARWGPLAGLVAVVLGCRARSSRRRS